MSLIAFESSRTALVLIDLQHSIVGRNLEPHTGSEVVARCSELATAARQAGAMVIFVRVLITDMLKLPADVERPQTSNPPENACEIVLEAGIQTGDLLVTKRQWGAFYATELDQQLRRKGIKTIVLGGIATNFGVESTARAAFDQGYEIVFVSDAMAGPNAEMHYFSVQKLFPIMGRVRTTQEILDSLKEAH